MHRERPGFVARRHASLAFRFRNEVTYVAIVPIQSKALLRYESQRTHLAYQLAGDENVTMTKAVSSRP